MQSLESRIEKLEAAIGGITKVVVVYGDAPVPDGESVQVYRVRYVRPAPREGTNES